VPLSLWTIVAGHATFCIVVVAVAASPTSATQH
jgi:ABC-type spermidine/putrescine transport system permease subunit II